MILLIPMALIGKTSTGNGHPDEIKVYPNPATNYIVFVWNEMPEAVMVINAQGRIMIEEYNPGYKMDISHLPQGIYFINVINSKGEGITHVIKKQ